ncbi:MAG: hypothetical protein V3T83_20295 [Acidobacteriota bacterium]
MTIARSQNPPQISVTFYVNGMLFEGFPIDRSLNLSNSARLTIGRRSP